MVPEYGCADIVTDKLIRIRVIILTQTQFGSALIMKCHEYSQFVHIMITAIISNQLS